MRSSSSASCFMHRRRPWRRWACCRFSSGLRHHPVDVWRRLRHRAGLSRRCFGTQFVGAIHGRLLTAWSTAGIIGPVVVNYMHDTRKAEGIAPDQIYHPIFYVLAGLLVAGFIANLLIRPLDKKWFMKEEEVRALQAVYRGSRQFLSGVKAVAAQVEDKEPTSRPFLPGPPSAFPLPGGSGLRWTRPWRSSNSGGSTRAGQYLLGVS